MRRLFFQISLDVFQIVYYIVPLPREMVHFHSIVAGTCPSSGYPKVLEGFFKGLRRLFLCSVKKSTWVQGPA
jgi:hypothetical protein